MKTNTTNRRRAAARLLAAGLLALPAFAAHAQDQGVGGILDRILRGREGQENSRGRYDTDNSENTTTRGGSRSLRARITTDRSEYAPGRPVNITLSLTNIGDRRVDVSNAQEYDILVRDARNSGSILWQSSRDGQARDRRRMSFRIEPGQTRTYRETWDQMDRNGRRVRAGSYRIEARIYPQEPVYAPVFLSTDGSGRPGSNGGYNGGGRGDDYDDRDDRGGYTAGVRSDLRLDQPSSVVRPGDTVRLTYTLLNADTSRSRTFRFNSGKQFDALVSEPARRGGGGGVFGSGNGGRARTVWQLSRDQFYTQALTQFTLRPGERRNFTASWRTPRDLQSGVYTVTAFLTPQGDTGGSGRAGAYEASASLRVAGGSGNGSYDDRDYRDRSPLPPTLDPNRDDRYGRDRDDRGGGYSGGNLPRGRAEVIRLRDLERGIGRDYVGRRVSVTGVYQGVDRGGFGGSTRRGEWSLMDGGVTLSVTGAPAPDNRREGDRITVTGTLRRFALNGNYYLEAD